MSAETYIIFVKYPEPGKVKTRLAEAVTADKAAALYRCLVERLVSGLEDSFETHIFVSPSDRVDDVREWLGESFSYSPQSGEDIGDRMYNAFESVFEKGCEKAVLTGSDIPELTSCIIKNAFDMLDKKDAVIGKAEDGGYYLIGFKNGRQSRKLFKNINWSTDIVFSQTMDIFKEINCSVAETAVLSDLDTSDDLFRMRDSLKDIIDKTGI